MGFSAFHVSDPRVVYPRTYWWSDLFVLGDCSSQPPKRLHHYCDHSYTDHCYRASWAHASQPHLPKSYRGSFSLFCYFQCLIRITLSPKIGSSNLSHFRTWLSPQTPLMAQVMQCRCIQMSAEVCAIALRSQLFCPSSVTEWNSGDRTQTILWNPTSNTDVVFHGVTLQASGNTGSPTWAKFIQPTQVAQIDNNLTNSTQIYLYWSTCLKYSLIEVNSQ